MNLAYLFNSPSSFENDAKGFALNAAGHTLAVGAVGYFLLPIWIVLVLYAIWELAQWYWRKAEDWDCFHDWAFVSSGALSVHEPLILFPLLGFYLAGILRRTHDS